MAAGSTQVAPAQEAGRPQPQTTVEPPGGPFVRHSQPGRRAQYASTNNAFGALVTQPLVATPGYLRGLRVRIAGTGGAGTTTVTAAADAPWNVAALITLRDAFGTPLIVGDGFSVLKMIPKYGGQFGLHALSDPANLPSFSAVATGVSSSGNFVLSSMLPFEFAKAYGVISGANASLLPTLQWQLGSSASFFGVAPNTTLPVMEIDVDADFYWLPEGANVEPPGLGSTCQWILQQANPTIGSASTTRVSLPRLGGYLTTLIFILRDATGARVDPFTASNRFRLYLDGVPIIDTRWDTFLDDMAIQFAGAGTGQWTRDTGVWAVTRKTALNQESLGLMDTGETWLSTNPGTLIEIEGSPWAVIGSPPATLNVLVGQVVPAGSIVQGLPEL